MCRAAFSAIAQPASGPPVKAIRSTSRCVTSASPISVPKPVTTFTTPGGKPAASTSLTNSSSDADVNSEGFRTTVHPAASAGASLRLVSGNGEFHGMMQTTTPDGSSFV